MCCFSVKYAALRRKSKVWLSRNPDIISIHGLLFQLASTKKNPTKGVGLVQSRPHYHLVKMQVVLDMIELKSCSHDVKQK